jgi:serine protease Do
MSLARPFVIGIVAGVISVAAAMAQVPRIGPTAPQGSYLGVMVQEIDAARAKALKLNEEAGVDITRVEPGSPADKAGLKPGDVVIQYNGQRVEGMETFSRFVRETPAGREVKLGIVRDGMPQTITTRVEARRGAPNFGAGLAPPSPPPGFSLPGPPPRPTIPVPDMPGSFLSWRSGALGIEAESLQGQLAQYFGVSQGVLVRSVVKDSAAEKAGIKAGDVITKVGDNAVTAPMDISRRVRSLRGRPVVLILTRDHKEISVTLTLADDQAGSFWDNRFPPELPSGAINFPIN